MAAHIAIANVLEVAKEANMAIPLIKILLLLSRHVLYVSSFLGSLREACDRGDLEQFKAIIAGTSSEQLPGLLHSQDGCNQWTLLHTAAAKGNLHIIQYLVDQHVSLEPVDYQGRTPLHVACEHGYVSVVQFLAEAGANIGATIDGGLSPLHKAAAQGHLSTVQYLIERGVGVDVKGDHGQTPRARLH